MEDNRTFKFIWRFNAIILMVAGILSIGILFFAGYHVIKDAVKERNTRNIVNVDEDDSIDEKWELGRLYEIEGTSFLQIPLVSDQRYAQSYSSKSSDSVRNYLYIDTKNNTKNWLFKTNEFLVADIDYLSEKIYNTEDRIVRAILYTVIEKDTNGDKRLTTKDDKTIAISMPNGQGLKKLFTGIDIIIGHQVINKENMFIVYQIQNKGFSAYISLKDFTIGNETELPKLKN